jgi:3-keto-disaccharide hydrolase
MRRTLWALAAIVVVVSAATANQSEPSFDRTGYRPLFNGKDLTGWKLRHEGAKNGWTVRDGLLTNTPPSTDLYTEEKFQDFQLHVEYMIPPRSNSGIYLRGRYEIQIMDDAGKPTHNRLNGSIYGRIAPTVNATKPAGEWQTVDATLVGKRVTVVLNGQKIIDNAEIAGPTGAALDDRESEPGPILLQGDHGQVSFRNLYIKPL